MAFFLGPKFGKAYLHDMNKQPHILFRWGRFFPIQLLALHFKRSLILLLFWVLLFGFVTRSIADAYGIPLLFLAPEYLGAVGLLSFFITGLFGGLFFMAFHVSTYIYYSHKFTFLATLEKPLYRFSVNNSILPFVFVIVYLIFSYRFQTHQEGINSIDAFLNVIFWILGAVVSISLVFTYFFSTNRNLFQGIEKRLERPLELLVKKSSEKELSSDPQKTSYYLRNFMSMRVVRSTEHYPPEILSEILAKHHRNAGFFILALFVLILGFGLLREHAWANLPAAASIFLLFTLYLMFTAILHSWFKSWYSFGMAAVLIGLQFVSQFSLFEKVNHAFGLDYVSEPATYNFRQLQGLTTDSILTYDRNLELKALQSWKKKTGEKKPKLIILNTSGGGLRSAVFTYAVMEELDSLTDGRFFGHTRLITGASGGMLGAAYYRAVRHGENLLPYTEDILKDQLNRDLLNPVVFTLATSDLFFNPLKWKVGDQSYNKDRGYAFEQALNKNTFNLLDVPLSYYTVPELEATLPKMVFSPIVVNDGRRLLISSSPTAYLALTGPDNSVSEFHDGIEFRRFFKDLRSDSLRFTSAIRMSASFPYITPLINLPSSPAMELIDAGARDNNGFELSLRYVYQFNEWIEEHTSGVIFVRLRSDGLNDTRIKEERNRGIAENLLNPVGGVIKSFDNMQDFNQSQLLLLASEWCTVPLEVIELNLFEKEEAVSLSWHLTQSEKNQISRALRSSDNQDKIEFITRELQ